MAPTVLRSAKDDFAWIKSTDAITRSESALACLNSPDLSLFDSTIYRF